MFNHLLTREEARVKKMNQVFTTHEEGKVLKEMFGRFKEAWNIIGFDKKIQYGCKEVFY